MHNRPVLTRVPPGPLLTRDHLPPVLSDASSVFNPGAIRIENQTFLLLRVQTRGRRTLLLPACSSNGQPFRISSGATELIGTPDLKIFHNYDPRLTLLDNQLLVTTALDTDRGGRCALWRAIGRPDNGFAGLDKLEFIGLTGDSDTRNAVLFPERIQGRYHLLQRPNQASPAGTPHSGSSIHLLTGQDLKNWQDRGPIMTGNPHFWDELIGPGPPPIKTHHGWLLLYHGVATHFQTNNIYQVGAVLLDLARPHRVIGRTGDNILEPRANWELTGQVPNVVFPSGLISDRYDEEGFAPDDARLRLYYGAADTVVGLAEGTVGGIAAACR